MNKLWKFEIDFGRMGTISSTFFATEKEIEWLKNQRCWLSDVLGKHSEIEIEFDKPEEYELTEIKLKEETLHDLYDTMGALVGGWFYPWDWIEESEGDECP